MSFPAGVGLGAGVSFLLTVLLACVLAWMMEREILRENGIGISSAVILSCSALLGAVIASGRIKHRHLLACMATGSVYYMILLCCTALFFGGQYDGMLATALVVAGGSAAAAIRSLKWEGRTKRKHRLKIASR